jgi:hypothetical protein
MDMDYLKNPNFLGAYLAYRLQEPVAEISANAARVQGMVDSGEIERGAASTVLFDMRFRITILEKALLAVLSAHKKDYLALVQMKDEIRGTRKHVEFSSASLELCEESIDRYLAHRGLNATVVHKRGRQFNYGRIRALEKLEKRMRRHYSQLVAEATHLITEGHSPEDRGYVDPRAQEGNVDKRYKDDWKYYNGWAHDLLGRFGHVRITMKDTTLSPVSRLFQARDNFIGAKRELGKFRIPLGEARVEALEKAVDKCIADITAYADRKYSRRAWFFHIRLANQTPA